MNNQEDEYIPPKSVSHSQTEYHIQTKHAIENPNFLVIDEIFNDYITKHKRRYYSFRIKCDFKLIFNIDFSKRIHIKGGYKLEINDKISSPPYTCKTMNDENDKRNFTTIHL